MAAKKYFADDTIKSSHSPGPVYYVPWNDEFFIYYQFINKSLNNEYKSYN